MRSDIIKRTVALLSSVAVCAALTVIPSPAATAESASSLKNKISEYEEKQEEIEEKLAALEDEQADAESTVDALSEKIENLEYQISLVNETIDALNDKIAEAEKKIEQKEKEVEQAKETLKQRLKAIYIAGSNSNLKVLLSADSYSDYLAKAELMRGVTKHDTELMSKLNDDIKEINKLKEEIEDDKAEAKEMKASLVEKQNELDSDYQKAQSAYNKLQSQQSNLESEADEIAEAKAAAEAEWRAAIQAESDRQRRMQSSSSSSNSDDDSSSDSSSYSSGPVSDFGFVWPFQSSYYISCGYQGYYGHTGVDITCSGALGKPIYAAASGRVIRATYSNVSYGNCIIIDHGTKDGSSVSTLYAHCNSLLVSYGEEVEQGQLIAYCGTTGNSTGPHLHFEVRIDGDPINPLSCF